MFISFLLFLAQLIIAGTLIRLVLTKYPESSAGKALAYIF